MNSLVEALSFINLRQQDTYLTGLCEWMAEHSVGGLAKRQSLLIVTRVEGCGKLWLPTFYSDTTQMIFLISLFSLQHSGHQLTAQIRNNLVHIHFFSDRHFINLDSLMKPRNICVKPKRFYQKIPVFRKNWSKLKSKLISFFFFFISTYKCLIDRCYLPVCNYRWKLIFFVFTREKNFNMVS